MPKISSPRRKGWRISQVFRRHKKQSQDPSQERTCFTTADTSSAAENLSPSTSMQANVSSATESNHSDMKLKDKENRPAPNCWAQSSEIIFPNSSAGIRCPVHHSSNISARHFELWHDEDSPVGLIQDPTARHSMYDISANPTERQTDWGRSEIIIPSRNSPDTPFSPTRTTLHNTPRPAEAIFNQHSLSNGRSSSYHPPSPAKTRFNEDAPSEPSYHYSPRPASAAFSQIDLPSPKVHVPRRPIAAAFSQVDLPLRRFTAPIRSSPKETPVRDRSPAELDGQRVTRPVFSGNFGSEFILSPIAMTERAFSPRTTDFGKESHTPHDPNDIDTPVTSLTERAFGLRNDSSIIELPINSSSSIDFILPPTAMTERALSPRSTDSGIESPTSHDINGFDTPVTSPTERAFGLQHDNSIFDLLISGGSSVDSILPPTAMTERALSPCTTDSGIESPKPHDINDFDTPITSPTERAFGLRHDNSIIDFPIKRSSSVDLSSDSATDEITSKSGSEYEDDVLSDHEDGIAYEDDEAWCGKCGGPWWADQDRYKTVWRERPRVEGLVGGEIEKWRCHRCEQVRIRKKMVVLVEAEMRGSVESFRTAIEENGHPREVEADVEKRISEEESKKFERRMTHVPGAWPEV
ncbi:hypothetical protein EG328_011950 [Venturia inaequalis]|uniref:Uncharacterized protein n=1 Tax=Venturia inaequalis TaxID=5025 RepID=A0A8H3V4M2_VENIN|nr:hypothetical protein EG328_011950 [Venturia inaequalis]